MRRYDILALGDPVLDLVVDSAELPRWDDKHLGASARWFSGGTEANAVCTAASLGLRCALLGHAGQGPAAALHRQDLAAHGVSLEFLRSDAGTDGAVAVVYVSPAGERAVSYVPTRCHAPDTGHLQGVAAAAANARLLYTLPYDAAQLLQVAAIAHAHDARLAVDVERAVLDQPGMRDALCQGPDLLCFNAAGFRCFTGDETIDAFALQRVLGQVRAQAVVVSLGSAGAVGLDRLGPAVHQPAAPARVVDATGAGDAFHGAVVAGWLRGAPMAQTLAQATRVAGRCIEAAGPRGHLSRLGELRSAPT